MPAIFHPQDDKEFFTPFGPMMGYYRMPDSLVQSLNAAMSRDLPDHSESLVGKVRQELGFTPEIVDMAAAALGQDFQRRNVYLTLCSIGNTPRAKMRSAQ